MKYFICSKCGKKKYTKPHRYRKILIEQYNNDRSLLKNSYICRNCKFKSAKRWVSKKIISSSPSNLSLEQTNSYKEISKLLSDKAEILYANGIQYKECRDAYYFDVKKILGQYNIVDFSINILNNRVSSITIRGLPFIETYEIKLNEGNKNE